MLWSLPFSVTEASLLGGSQVARRLPDALARLLRAGFGMEARWAPLVVEVEEGLGYAVFAATADAVEPRARLRELGGGDYLLFGQLELLPEQVWLDARLFGASHDETLLYPGFSGTPAGFLAALPELAAEIALGARWRGEGGAVAGPGAGGSALTPVARLLTGDWTAFTRLCQALDRFDPERPDPAGEDRALALLREALQRDSRFGLAARFGLEIAAARRAGESLEHCFDLADELADLCPDLPEIPLFRAELFQRLGRPEDARREIERARELGDREDGA